jgi:hypothetical protein
MKKNPMGIAIAVVLVLFFLLFGWMGYAHAAGLTGIVYTASVGKGYDNNWEVAACTLYVQRYPHIDSVFKFAMARNNVDTLSYFKVITPSQINPDYEPHAWGRITTTLGLRVPVDVEKAVSMLTVDSARSSNASVVLDSASLAAIIAAINSGAAGLGDYPETLFVYDSAQSAVVMGARLLVFAPDTGSYQNSSGPQYTDIFGKAIYSLDSGTYPVAISSQGYFQAGAYSLIHVTAPGGRDTVFVYGFSPTSPPTSAECNVVVFTNDPGSLAYVSIKESDHQDTSGVVLSPTVDVTPADINGTIQLTLPRSASTRQHSKWKIQVRDSYNNTMISVDDYEVPDQTIDTLLVEEEN